MVQCGLSCVGGVRARRVAGSLGKNFGSLCFGSLVLALLQLVRAVLDTARRSANQGDNVLLKVVMCLVMCLFDCIYHLIEMFTSFCTVVIAVSGQSFCSSAKTVCSVMKRNGCGRNQPLPAPRAARSCSGRCAWRVGLNGCLWMHAPL
jgi:hypothetical protein